MQFFALVMMAMSSFLAEFKACEHVHPCHTWSEITPDYANLEPHTKYVKVDMLVRILIGHTVTDHENPMERVRETQHEEILSIANRALMASAQ